jgi:hypothetical protein
MSKVVTESCTRASRYNWGTRVKLQWRSVTRGLCRHRINESKLLPFTVFSTRGRTQHRPVNLRNLRMNQSDPVFVIDSTSGFACHAEASAKAGRSSFWEQLCSQA